MRKPILAINLFVLFCFILAAPLQAGKKAGEVFDDTLYVDNSYDFSIKILDNWKVKKIGDFDDIRRVLVIKRNPIVPSHFGNDRSYFTRPMLTILVDSTDLSVDSLKTLVMNQDDETPITKEAQKSFLTISRSEHHPEFDFVRRVKINKMEGIQIPVRKEYRYHIYAREGRQGADLVQDFIRGSIFILQKNDLTFMIEIVSEKARYSFNETEFEAMINALVLKSMEGEETGEKKGAEE